MYFAAFVVWLFPAVHEFLSSDSFPAHPEGSPYQWHPIPVLGRARLPVRRRRIPAEPSFFALQDQLFPNPEKSCLPTVLFAGALAKVEALAKAGVYSWLKRLLNPRSRATRRFRHGGQVAPPETFRDFSAFRSLPARLFPNPEKILLIATPFAPLTRSFRQWRTAIDFAFARRPAAAGLELGTQLFCLKWLFGFSGDLPTTPRKYQ